MNHVDILGIDFLKKSFVEVVGVLTERIHQNEKTFVVTANPEIVMYTRENPEYKETVKNADFVVPDGSGIILAAKILNHPLSGRVTGYDLMIRLLELANQNQWRIYLLGGQEETNQKAAVNIRMQFPNAQLVGARNGFFNWEDNTINEEIQSLSPDLVFVCLGFPRQEKWIAENLVHFSKGVFIGVGGSIDVIAGEVKRAPEVWQKMNLEWFYRLMMQPSRWRRMLALPRFLIQILKIRSSK
jgi:N-acetylglucosaminyldiphosphoundecaprenol N-acetyl-beta-D-mannosaminyltransferase